MPHIEARAGMMLPSLKPALLSLLLVWQAAARPAVSPEDFRYERALRLPSSTTRAAGQACAVLDGDVLTHAASSLKDVRLYGPPTEAERTEIPYAITLSEPLQQDTDDARILNLGERSGHLVFDLAMPERPYTSVALELAAQDFIATADVSGGISLESSHVTRLGSFTLFDLTGQHLSRSTTIPLAESNFRVLHVELTLTPAPGSSGPASALNRPSIVKSATVPPSREAQTIYTTLQQSANLTQRHQETVATFEVPVRVPVERIEFRLDPAFKGSFSRTVRITALTAIQRNHEQTGEPVADSTSAGAQEAISGTILSVHRIEAGHEIAYQSLSIPVAIGSNMQRAATIQVAIDNGNDAPLPLSAILLEMRQRLICFDAGAASIPLTLYYGDSELTAPVYDYAKLFQPAAHPLLATLGPEAPNPAFVARADTRPLTERYPELLWIVLLLVVCILALTAIRSARKIRP